MSFEGNGYTVCEADLRQDAIQLFWKKGDGRPYGFLQGLPKRVDEHSGPLLFATNAGMFDPNFKPVGPLSRGSGARARQYEIRPWQFPFETERSVLRRRRHPWGARNRCVPQAAPATGPGDAIWTNVGVLNADDPRFVRYGASRKRRGGVGSRDSHTVVFAVSDSGVTFQEFGRLFRDDLKCRNALFLDGGSVPSLYVPSMKTGTNFLRIGPMIGAFAQW